MKGFVAKVSFDFAKGCSYGYFKTEEEAKAWAESENKTWKDILKEDHKIEIEPCEVKECAVIGCTKLIDAKESICLRCEQIQYDQVIEAREQELSEQELEEFEEW